MDIVLETLSKKQRNELEGYIAISTTAVRVLGFLAVVILVGVLSLGVYKLVGSSAPALEAGNWWAVLPLVFGVWLYRRSGRWTGGKAFRAAVKRDLENGQVAVRRGRAVDAIEVEEREDEGESFYVLTDQGQTILFSGQYVSRLKGRGFPWSEFEISESPESKVFFGVSKKGERVTPSARRPPFGYEEEKALGIFESNFLILDCDFNSLKEDAQKAAAAHAANQTESIIE